MKKGAQRAVGKRKRKIDKLSPNLPRVPGVASNAPVVTRTLPTGIQLEGTDLPLGFSEQVELASADHEPNILVINSGSSSIKFALFSIQDPLVRTLRGKIDRGGVGGVETGVQAPSAANALLDWLGEQGIFRTVRAVGHRVVHGLHHSAPERITQPLLDELHRIVPFAPDHLPHALELIEAIHVLDPALPQIACFDTAFHQTLPRVARMLPIPRRFEAQGIQRFGFHGLSYAFLMEELVRLGDPAATRGRVILAHLGSGASLAAVRDGRSIDTSMGLTPTAGIPMSTRSGDLDPALFDQLARIESMTPAGFHRMVTRESGLLGLSETSGDIRDLLAREAQDVRAAEAVALFCYQTKKWIGSFTAALGGLDSLVFSGGIGENAPVVRARICEGLGFLGIELDEQANTESAQTISSQASRVRIRVIRTDEERMIARSVVRSGATGRGDPQETTWEAN